MKIFCVFVCFIFLNQLSIKDNKVIYLKNDSIVVGVLPDIGGRIVYFGTKNGGNVLKAVPSLWNDSTNNKPGISEVINYKAYHGNIIWPSPMNEWWSKQNVFPQKRINGNRWPPDPTLIYGEYKIIEQHPQSLKWESLPSPVSGIQVTQQIELQEGNEMVFKVQFKNITDSIIHWGIWFNTRLEGRANCYVRASDKRSFYIHEKEKLKRLIPSEFDMGYFSFLSEKIQDPYEKIYTKVGIDAADNFIAAFSGKQLLLIETPGIDRKRIHPDHTFVEIYNQLMPDSKDDLCELEFHSEYEEIKPGEIIEAYQIWKVYDTKGIKGRKNQITYLNTIKP